jgi:hypothetical protein
MDHLGRDGYWAYAKRALMKLPSLEEYEQKDGMKGE